MLRYVRRVVEFVAAFVGVFVMLGLILVWRLNASPVRSAVLTPYIEAGIVFILPGTHVQIAHTLLTWDNSDLAVELHADGIQVKNAGDTVIAEVPDMDIRLNLFGIVIGQFLPKTLVIEHPQIKLERAADGKLYFGNLTTAKPGGEQSVRIPLMHIAHSLSHAYFMERLQVTRGVIDVYDDVSKNHWSISVPEIKLERSMGALSGHAAIALTQKDETSTLDVHYTYDLIKSLHMLKTRFENITPSALAGGHPEVIGLSEATRFDMPLSGDVEMGFDSNLNVASGAWKIHGEAGTVHAPELWDQPRAVKNLDIEATYDAEAPKLTIPSATFDFGGPKVTVAFSGKAPKKKTDDLDFTMTVGIADWPMNDYTQLWPKPLIVNAREWIAANMSKGKFDRGEATFKGSLAWNDLDNVSFSEAQGKLSASQGTVKYMDGMPAVQNVGAEASFDLKQMTVQITGGGFGNLALEPFAIKMTDLDTDNEYIDIPLKLFGPIPDVMKLIDEPPLQYAKAGGLTPGDVTGNAEGLVDLHFPLIKTLAIKDVDITTNMTLTDVASSKLVKGVDIAHGALALVLDKAGFTLKGPAAFNTVPLDVVWQQNFDTSNGKPLRLATLTGSVKDEQWSTLGFNAFNGSHGTVPLSLQLIQQNAGQASLSGTADMTMAEIHVDQLNWKKPSGAPVFLKFAADMPDGKDISVQTIDLSGPQVNIKGDATLTSAGVLKALKLDPMIVGRTNATLTVSQSNGALRFDANGAAFDVSGLRGGKDPDHSSPRPREFHIKVGKLYTSEDGFITHAEGFAIRDAEGWSAISLHGMADGAHQLDISLTPQNGGRAFSITCDDFGKALKGMGFTNTVAGGALNISGSSSADNPRVIDGAAKVDSFDVKGLPVLMTLMNATSPFGFTDLLSNSTSFDRLKGHFRWEGDTVDLLHVEASGKSVGMNVNGKIDMNSSAAKLHGTIVPFSIFNRIIGSIPLIGDLFTGGEGGGVLAVAFNLDGSLADPKISVNPVSLLTPGFLRNLFFGGDDDAPEDVAKDEPQTPESKPAASKAH